MKGDMEPKTLACPACRSGVVAAGRRFCETCLPPVEKLGNAEYGRRYRRLVTAVEEGVPVPLGGYVGSLAETLDALGLPDESSALVHHARSLAVQLDAKPSAALLREYRTTLARLQDDARKQIPDPPPDESETFMQLLGDLREVEGERARLYRLAQRLERGEDVRGELAETFHVGR